jgi:hypothetical protein
MEDQIAMMFSSIMDEVMSILQMECAFDLLKKRFNILVISDRFYSQRTLRLISVLALSCRT